MIREAFLWLAHSQIGVFMKDSTHAFAAVEATHLLGLAVLGGVVVLFGLASFRVVFADQPLVAVAKGLRPVFLTALTVMIATGFLLVASKPLRYYLSGAFRLKMVFFAVGIAAYLYLDRRARTAPPGGADRLTKIVAALILLSWLGVGLAGRFIGLL